MPDEMTIDRLEQRCEEPGLWLIEGIQVRRSGPSRKPIWVVVWEPGVRSESCLTLAEARSMIVDAINGIGPSAEVFR